MDFRFDDALPILHRTPAVLRQLLQDLPPSWLQGREGPDTWSPFDVLVHLIHTDRAAWVPRVEHILQQGEAQPFPPLDREETFAASRGLPVAELLETFDRGRSEGLGRLAELGLTDADLARRGRHPQFETVTLGQLLSTWVAHDLGHLSQVTRVMAKQYKEAVGPWSAYLPVLTRPL